MFAHFNRVLGAVDIFMEDNIIPPLFYLTYSIEQWYKNVSSNFAHYYM